MKKHLLFLLVSFVYGHTILCQSGGYITGKINISKQWSPKLYLSEITSFNDIYKMSNSMIISEAMIDSSGYFKFDLKNLSSNHSFYRIHISKKNAPSASLIIGGKDENHFFLIANNGSKINLDSELEIFAKVNFQDPNNRTIQYIDEVLRNIDSIDFRKTQIKRSFIVKAAEEKLRFLADTTSHPIVSLYALYKSNFKNNVIDHKEYYTKYLKKWEDENSSYFNKFRTELSINKPKNNHTYLILAILISFISGITIHKLFTSKNTNSKYKLLSIQERKILQLVQEGKSNKEISEELSIGLSTTKSHVSNMYSKLNIKSRKEAMDIK